MGKFKIALCIGVILIVVFSAFYPSLRNGFVNWDDNAYVTQNRFIRSVSLENIKQISSSFFIAHYQPITILSYLFEYHFFKLNPFGYHLTSLILHVLNCLLVFWLVFMLSGRISVAWLTAILFGIHPLQVESVAWISQRKNLLYALFFLAAIICYCYYRRGRQSKRYYSASLILFGLSLLSKVSAAAFPLVLFLVDYFFSRKRDKSWLIDKIPFFILSFIFGMVAFIGTDSFRRVGNEFAAHLINQIAIASQAIIFYLSKILLPLKLSCLYPFFGIEGTSLSLYFMITLIMLFAIVISSRKYTRKVIFGSSFFLISILPALRWISIGEMVFADRYVYLSSLGVFYILAEGLFWLYSRQIKYFSFLRCLILVVIMAGIGVLISLTWQRCQVWKNSLSLWSDVLKNYPNVAPAYNQRGEYLLGTGKYDQARSDFLLAINTSVQHPHYKLSRKYYYLNLGNLYRATGKNPEAIAIFEQLIKSNPRDAEAYFNLANLYDTLDEKDKAMAFYKRAIEIDPQHVNARYYLSVLYDKLNRKEAKER